MPSLTKVLKAVWGSIASLVLIGLFIYFLMSQKEDLVNIGPVIHRANLSYFILGITLTVLYVILQGFFYRYSLLVLHRSISAKDAIILYLKRFFVSTFLPAGFTVVQFTMPRELSRYNVTELENHFAAVIFLMLGTITYLLFLIPTIILLAVVGQLTSIEWYGTVLVVIVIALLFTEFYKLLKKEGLFYRVGSKIWTELPTFISSWQDKSFDIRSLELSFGASFLSAVINVFLFYVTFKALGIPADIFIALVGFVLTVLISTISPIFQGIGVVEFSLVFALTQLGLERTDALAATILFRVFQLWLPLLIGMYFVIHGRIKRVVVEYNGADKIHEP